MPALYTCYMVGREAGGWLWDSAGIDNQYLLEYGMGEWQMENGEWRMANGEIAGIGDGRFGYCS